MKLLAFLITIITAFYLQATELVWNSKDNFKDWKRFRFCSKKVENGILKLYDLAFDSCIVNDSINCNPANFNALSITYRAKDITIPSTGEVFFAHGAEKFSQSRCWAIPSLKSDGNWHTLIIKPKNLKSWLTGGNINSLRIDMVNKPGGTIEIKEIKLQKIDNTTKNSNVTNNVNNNNIWSNDKLKLWKYFHNCNGKVVNNILSVNITKSDSKIFTNNLSVNPKDANVFVIVYRAKNIKATSGELYFARDKENFSDARKWRIPALISDNTWHTLKIDDKYLNNKDQWYNKGVVTKLRLDPTNAAGGTIEIKEIRFEKKNSVKALPKLTIKMDEPLWPSVKSQLKKENTTAPYFNAKMIRAPQDTLKGKMMRPFYVRKKFTLKDKPTHAKLQFTADDYSQVVINGNEVAFSNSWRETVNADVVQYLKKGDNVIGFQYYNKDTWGGVFGELYLQFKDNSSLRINTNKSFKSSDKAFPNWATVTFDDSKWDNVIEQLGPPNKPWVVKLGYTFYKDLQKLTFAKVNKNKVICPKLVFVSGSMN